MSANFNPFDIIAKAAEGITNSISGAVEKCTTSDEEKLTLKNELTGLILPQLNEALAKQRDILVTEMQGSKLQRNWRPIIALSFGFIVVSTYFLFPIVNIWLKNPEISNLITDLKANDKFWTLLELMIGGYVAGRTVEKVAETVSKNVDLSMLKKKDRKEKIQ